MQLPILATGAKAWKAGHEAVRGGEFIPAQTQFDRPEKDALDFAAGRARAFVAGPTYELHLTPRERVRVFNTYMYAFMRSWAA
ncbi:MAG TPA: hypothetical protein VF120_13920 [Ktedonobacterales bacterium]